MNLCDLSKVTLLGSITTSYSDTWSSAPSLQFLVTILDARCQELRNKIRQILPHWQAEKLECHSLMDDDRKHEIPGSETEDYYSQQLS